MNKPARTHTCSDWEISNCNRKIERRKDNAENYRCRVNAHINDLVAYAEEAEEYALCEMESLD
ncbi:MAG: hypothetical protein WEA77_03975 [Hyphomonas sp.]|uniref:hypothetical protein n=1 Tax=Hyphomonas sp. TaxID=87 RepID=UPI0034A0180F